jgi:hypothetical protein
MKVARNILDKQSKTADNRRYSSKKKAIPVTGRGGL